VSSDNEGKESFEKIVKQSFTNNEDKNIFSKLNNLFEEKES
jgi:hypothetical protein